MFQIETGFYDLKTEYFREIQGFPFSLQDRER
jgi:hypothetical protein